MSDQSADDVLPRAIEPRSLDHMVSARFEPNLVVAMRERATALGITMSQLIREAAWRYLLDVPPPGGALNDGAVSDE